MNKGYMLNGVVVFIAGVYMFKTGWVKKFQGPVHPGVGIFCAIVGLIFFIIGIFSPSKINKDQFYICERCKKTFKKEHVEILICPICDGTLVEKTQEKNK